LPAHGAAAPGGSFRSPRPYPGGTGRPGGVMLHRGDRRGGFLPLPQLRPPAAPAARHRAPIGAGQRDPRTGGVLLNRPFRFSGSGAQRDPRTGGVLLHRSAVLHRRGGASWPVPRCGCAPGKGRLWAPVWLCGRGSVSARFAPAGRRARASPTAWGAGPGTDPPGKTQ
jgi:hypothetical protein